MDENKSMKIIGEKKLIVVYWLQTQYTQSQTKINHHRLYLLP